jgi:hypothetical protein
MLDPELLAELAAHPERNAPEVNVALAEQGETPVLLALAGSAAVGAEALATIAARIAAEGDALELDDDLDGGAHREPALLELDRLLVANPQSPDAVRDGVLGRHPADPWFVLAASTHPRASLRALEAAARWPSRQPALDRSWIAAIQPDALPPLVAEEWAQSDEVLLREAAARLAREEALLARLAADDARQVRRAVSSNPYADGVRERLAGDPAVEVRARAQGAIGHHGPTSVGSARFAAALRAMQSGGVLAPDVAEALSCAADLEQEGALLAARVLPRPAVVRLIREAERADVAVGLAAGLALRDEDAEDERRELVVDAAKALSQQPAQQQYGALTGKARLAAWLGEGVAQCRHLDRRRLVAELTGDVIAGEVLSRSVAVEPALLSELCGYASGGEPVPAALLPLAWHSPALSDDAVVDLAKRIAPLKRRGQDLAEDELDLEPTRRPLEVLEQVVLAASRRATVSPRAALAVAALDARRVRYVLTALPAWRGRLGGTMLGRVLKQNAGALAVAKSEARRRFAALEPWTERILNDIEVAVAIAVGHFTAKALVDRLVAGRHKLVDGTSVASGADARATLEGPEAIRPLVVWAAQQRGTQGAALSLWLLLERFDRERPPTMIASGIDSLASRDATVSADVSEALATLERRQPGRLEAVAPQTPRGKATLASALARAYRAVGGLRDERG